MVKTFLLTLTLLADTTVIAVPPGSDVVYLKSDRAGVFTAERGRIEAMTGTELILRTYEGRYILLTREAVKRVDLSAETYASHPQWEQLVRESWNATAYIVRAVQALPVVGGPLNVLNDIPGSVASMVAILALSVALLWAILKIHEIAIVNRDTRRLSRLKLQLEIAKLRQEAINLGGQQNDRWLPVLQEIELPFSIPKPQHETLASSGRFGRFMEALGELFMSSSDRATLRAICSAEVAAWLKRGRERAKKARLRRTVALAVGIAACIFFGFSVVSISIRRILEGYGVLDPLFEGIIGLFLLRQAVRLVMTLRDVRLEYRVVG